MSGCACFPYALNKCASAEAPDHVKAKRKKYSVYKSYVGESEECRSGIDSFPGKSLLDMVEKAHAQALSRATNERNMRTNLEKVEKLKTMGDFMSVLVAMISATKSVDSGASISQQVRALEKALVDFQRNKLDAGMSLFIQLLSIWGGGGLC